MNVRMPSVVDSVELAATGRWIEPDLIELAPEWIDPEGDDWYAELYRQIASDEDRATSSPSLAPDPGYWFG